MLRWSSWAGALCYAPAHVETTRRDTHMVTQAAKELFALFNVLGGMLLAVGLLIYLVRGRPRRGAVILLLLLLIFVCFLNAVTVYFLL